MLLTEVSGFLEIPCSLPVENCVHLSKLSMILIAVQKPQLALLLWTKSKDIRQAILTFTPFLLISRQPRLKVLHGRHMDVLHRRQSLDETRLALVR